MKVNQFVWYQRINSQVDQTEELLKKLLEALTPAAPHPVRTPDVTPLDKLTELLMSQIVKREPAPPTPVKPTGLEALLHTYFTRQQSPGLGPRFRQMQLVGCEVFLMWETGS